MNSIRRKVGTLLTIYKKTSKKAFFFDFLGIDIRFLKNSYALRWNDQELIVEGIITESNAETASVKCDSKLQLYLKL